MKTLAIIKTGSTFPTIKQQFGDFENWIIAACVLPTEKVLVVNVHEGDALPPITQLSGIIITGSPAMVTDQQPWMLALAAWLPSVITANLPLLGICFGHQILAQALGGTVDYHPQGREIGTVDISLTAAGKTDKLLGSLPHTFKAHVTHAQSVLTLPSDAHHLAENPFESNHALRLGENAWSVQFHPEFSADIMREYINQQAEALLINGRDINSLQNGVEETRLANGLLKRFMEIVHDSC
jgi:GMP synthase (glutamine-hydrolysing)